MPLYDLSGKNKYYTLYSGIRQDILRGKFAPGQRLPSKRALAADLGVSVVTVQLAYEQLLAEGYVCSRERSGYFVERVTPAPAPQAQALYVEPEEKEAEAYKLDLVKGYSPAELFPFSVWAKLTRAVLADCGEHLLERVPCDGDRELKREIAAYLYRARGIDADPRYIVVGAGAEYLYGQIVQLLGRDKLFAVENPGYGKISATYGLYGAKVYPVEVIERGICLGQLQNSDCNVLHISPAHQFPTGVVTPAFERMRIIDWARRRDGLIIEDDYDSEFRLFGKPLHSLYSLCPERVIYMNTFSKTLAPSMRMGYMLLPPALYDRFIKVFASTANVVPLFEQKTLAAMLRGGYFERHVGRLKNYYRGVRRKLLEKLQILKPYCRIYDSGSGLHVLAHFPNAQSDDQIKARAKSMGIRVKCLSDYLVAPMSGITGYVVVNYSGIRPKQLDELEISLD